MSSSQTVAPPQRALQPGRLRPALLVAALAPLLLFVGIAWFDYRLEVSRTREHAAATADALAEHAQKVVETVDLVLARIPITFRRSIGQPSAHRPMYTCSCWS